MTPHTHGKDTHVHHGTPGQVHSHGQMTLGSRRPVKLGPPAVWDAPVEERVNARLDATQAAIRGLRRGA